jgi:hypothetical protein
LEKSNISGIVFAIILVVVRGILATRRAQKYFTKVMHKSHIIFFLSLSISLI